MIDFIISILIGALSGWLAGLIMKTANNFWINIILGIVGGVIGKFLLGLVGLSASGYLGIIIASVLGACIIIGIFKLITKK